MAYRFTLFLIGTYNNSKILSTANRKERLAVPCCGARRGTSLEGPWKMAQLLPDGILHGIRDGSVEDPHGARSRATGKQNPCIAPAIQLATGSYFFKKIPSKFLL
jgi:hypothetical protein